MATEVSRLIDEGIARLQRAADDPRHEAQLLLGAALGRSRAWLIAHAEERVLDCEATDRYEAYVTRRAHGEPIAYILAAREFWSLPLEVTRDVLIPRPETELVVELALQHLPLDDTAQVLDLGTGSGAIALALAQERPRARIVGTDISDTAVLVARHNARRLDFANVEFRTGDWFAPVAGEQYELIASNPPYVAEGDARVEPAVRRYEPPGALFAGPDGLAALRTIVGAATMHLVTGGWLVVEHGDLQGPAVRGLFAAAGFTTVATCRDLAGRERCTEGRWTGAPEA